MKYKQLSKIYYAKKDSECDGAVALELQKRREAPSSFIIDYSTSQGQLFIAVPREISTLLERILRRERKITKLINQLPGIAGDEVLRSLVFDEVISSNAIENIHSTRRQIEEALRDSLNSKEKQRFREFARLYLDMTFSNPVLPKNAEDIRSIYNQIMDGEKLEDYPDGKLFRKDVVYITDGIKQIHAGVYPEDEIIDAIEKMLKVAYSKDMPSLFGALAAHYIFEYAHPFYDGNGRTGRYLLSLFLESTLSKPTAISLSRAIANDKTSYYKAFQIAENPKNHGELTFFIHTMLKTIMDAQDELIERLQRANDRYIQIMEACENLEKKQVWSEKELKLIMALAQQAEFGMFRDSRLDLLSYYLNLGTQQTRKYLSKMEDAGVVEKIRGRNPVTFSLTEDFFQRNFAS